MLEDRGGDFTFSFPHFHRRKHHDHGLFNTQPHTHTHSRGIFGERSHSHSHGHDTHVFCRGLIEALQKWR
ncbi:hypothetical protein BGY98DRAFT_1053536 [Russula aff. rugulosa BPL654]|nr:hypothetical protein BGY98DRAFT_1053536 [Russula aff. rugulosa BPL654]